MLKYLFISVSFLILFFITSCDKDAGLLPIIVFKTNINTISKDTTLAANTVITIGIEASKSEKNDVLKKFNISKSINGASSTTILNESLSGSQGDSYSYEYTTNVASVVGQKDTYTFTVTNRDGLVNQVSVAVTAK